MIHSFSCKNFYSFGDETKVSFVVNEKAPNDFGYFKSASSTRLSKIEAVMGSNASGKTNLLKVLPFLKWLIGGSVNLKPTDPIPLQPFMFDGKNEKLTDLSVEFEVDDDIYIYEVSLKRTTIFSEELKVKNKTKEKITNKRIFYREWNEVTKQYNFDDKSFGLPKGSESFLRTNASILGTAFLLNNKISQKVMSFWNNLETNVDEAGWIGDRLFPNTYQQLIETLIFFSDNELLKKEAEKLLCRFDIGLNELEIKTQKKENIVTSIEAKAAHLLNGEKQYLDFKYESSGTKQLFILLHAMLQALSKGGTVVLDELDVNLHPEMVLALIDLFIQPETNPKNAQMLFSTHSHLLLSKLDKYQILFVEKNKKGSSESWRLDEMSGVRADENYYSKYLAGAYGAVPKIK